jgi:hypothetical protein
MPCDEQEVNNGRIITAVFQGNNEAEINRILSCFKKVHFDYCKKTALKTIFSNRYKIRHLADELCDLAFNDALVHFYFHIREKGFEERGASVKTFFYQIFRNKLLSQIQKQNRYKDNPGINPDDLNM